MRGVLSTYAKMSRGCFVRGVFCPTVTLYHLSSEQEMKALIRLCRCNRLICAFDVRKGIKQTFLWPGFVYFLLPPGVGKRATCTPPHPRHCRIMNDFFFFLAFDGLVVGSGGGRGAREFATPFTPAPPNP